MVGRATRVCGRLAAIGLLTLGLVAGLAARPEPVGAELYSVEDVVDYMVPFLDAYWFDTFANWGLAYSSPDAVWYYNTWEMPGPTQSGCGDLGVNNAFYCWSDRSIYLDYTWLDQQLAYYGDFAVAAVIAHEWGHHVEQELGWSSAAFYSVQLELYADCVTGAVSSALEYQGALEADDLEEAYELALTIGDPIGTDPASGGAHGASEQRIESFAGGYMYGDPAVCGPVVDMLLAA